MLVELTKRLAFLLILIAPIFPQSTTKKEHKKEFGYSLKEFEKKGEPKPDQAAVRTDIDTIRVETNLVISDSLVIDKSGRVVTGLQKNDFVVTEDDSPQKIELFSFGDNERAPKSIVLIIDAGGIPSLFERNIRTANQLIDRLGPTDRMAIVSDNVKLLTDFTSDKKLLRRTLEGLNKSRGPSRREYSTLLAVLNEIFVGNEIRPIVLIQGSGDEMLMTKPIWPTTLAICRRGAKDYCERSFSFEDVLNAVERSRATIYGVVPEPKVVGLSREEQKRKVAIILDSISVEMHDRGSSAEKAKFRRDWEDLTVKEASAMQQSLIDVTRLSGGFTTFIESVDRVDELYRSLFATIENRYLIGYYSEKKGSRSIKLSVKGHPEYSVIARKSFVPSAAK